MRDSLILRTGSRGLAPIMLGVSLYLLVRGHDAVGGGFIGGLSAGAVVVLLYFSRGHERILSSRLLRYAPLVASGLLLAVTYGIAGLVLGGSFLAGAKFELPGGLEVAASLIFDVGVYLVVLGLIVGIMRHLGHTGDEGVTRLPERAVRR